MAGRGWVFTYNNPLHEPIWRPRSMNYFVYCLQKAPTTGTIHYQGYVQFHTAKDKTGAKKALPKRCWSKRAGGTWQHSRKYICEDAKETNQAEPVEHGVPVDLPDEDAPHQGERNDIRAAMADVREGKSVMQLREDHPSLMMRGERWLLGYRAGLAGHRLRPITYPVVTPWFTVPKPDPSVKRRHWWLVGAPDAGKSLGVLGAFRGMRVYLVGSARYPYEQYEDEDVIVYDDVVPTEGHMIRVTNTWPAQMHVAGECRYFPKFWKIDHCRTVIILSNYAPELTPAEAARFNVLTILGCSQP